MSPFLQIAAVILFLATAMGLFSDYRWSWPMFWFRLAIMSSVAFILILAAHGADLFRETFIRHD